MGTSVESIRIILERGIAQGATHVFIVCDTFDYEDYSFISVTCSGNSAFNWIC
jgi:hypothetical protein